MFTVDNDLKRFSEEILKMKVGNTAKYKSYMNEMQGIIVVQYFSLLV